MQTVPVWVGGAIPRLFFCAPRWRRLQVLALGILMGVLMCWSAAAGAEPVQDSWARVGNASWYGHEFQSRRTASGDRFDPGLLTGAHRTLPLGSKVRVTNLHNGRSVLVTINDRGPYRGRRLIDLSYGAARVLGMVQRGVARVRIELIDS